jgi:hypothetical protein
MKKKVFLFLFLIIPLVTYSQFEEKVSFSFSCGIFKTIGDKYGERAGENPLPRQMTWYKPGIDGDIGFQFRLNEHFSLVAEIGAMYSSKWECIQEDGYNWMSFELYDKIVIDSLLASGLNENSLLNISLTIKPKIYLLPQKKLNPFLFAGISINYTKTPFVNNYWKEYVAHDQYESGDNPDYPAMKNSTGLGINPGIGLEYRLNNQIGLSLTTGYYLVFIKQDKYPYDYRELIDGNLGAFQLRAGLRINFIKIKEL